MRFRKFAPCMPYPSIYRVQVSTVGAQLIYHLTITRRQKNHFLVLDNLLLVNIQLEVLAF